MKIYKIGIIGGSGIYTLQNYNFFAGHFFSDTQDESLTIERYKFNNCEIYFLPRHGKNHAILPHEIDYLGNMKLFKDLKVDGIISFCTIGSLDTKFQPGSYIIPKDIIDFTKNRKGENYVMKNKHVNIQPIFNKKLIDLCKQIFVDSDIPLLNDGVLTVIEGPRFATHSEQQMYKILGGNFVNMTQAQEIYLSHVFEIPFISLCHITDFTSIAEEYDIHSNEAIETFRSNFYKIEKILTFLVSFLHENNPEIGYYNHNQTFV